MTSQPQPIDKVQLCEELTLAEKILELASDFSNYDTAEELSLQLMKTQKTNTISSIDISEYLGFLSDAERGKRNNDIEAQHAGEENAALFLEDIQQDIVKAKRILGTVE